METLKLEAIQDAVESLRCVHSAAVALKGREPTIGAEIEALTQKAGELAAEAGKLLDAELGDGFDLAELAEALGQEEQYIFDLVFAWLARDFAD